MAETTDYAKLELQTNAAAFQKQISQAEGALESLQTQMRMSPQDFDKLDAAMDEQVDKLQVLRKSLLDVEISLDKLNAANGKAVNKLKGLGQVGLQTGRIIQDFTQGGIPGVLNNIEGFAQAVGGGPGLAGALTGLGVAVFVAKPYLDDFMTALSPEKPKAFKDAIEDLKGAIKELEEKPVKFGIDVSALETARRQLAELQAARAAFEAAGEGRTSLEKEAGSNFQKQFDELGGEGREARDAITDQQAKARDAVDPVINKALNEMAKASAEIQKAAKMYGVAPTVQPGSPEWANLPMAVQSGILSARNRKDLSLRTIGTQQAGNRQAAQDEIGVLFDQTKAGNSPEARKELADLFRGIGKQALAEMTDGSSPEALKKKRDAQQFVDFDEHLAKQGAADLKYMQEQDKKANDALNAKLNKQGKEGEPEALKANREMRQEQEAAQKLKDKATDARVKANEKNLDEREKSLKDTTLDEDAAEYAARIRAQGGDFGRNGQFRRLNPDQQRAAVANQVGRRVNSANPGLDPISRGALTERFTQGAYDQANAQAEQARMAIAQQAEANGVNLSAQQVTNAALQQALGALTAVAQKQRQEEARTQALARALGQVNRQVRMPGQPNLNMGHQ